jgi:hypothetical protein
MLGESFAFALRNESFALGEGDQCASMSGSKTVSLALQRIAGMQRTDAASKKQMLAYLLTGILRMRQA